MPTVPENVKLVACAACHMVKLIHQQSTRVKCLYCKAFMPIIVIQERIEVQIPVDQPEWQE